VTERHYAPWVKARQDLLEAEIHRIWNGDTSSGKSRGSRLPRTVVCQVGSDTVKLSIDTGTIMVQSTRLRYSLDDLTRRITKDNRRHETAWRLPVGNEAW
jgi:antitoxin component of MazEF toxin-antitoxin module